MRPFNTMTGIEPAELSPQPEQATTERAKQRLSDVRDNMALSGLLVSVDLNTRSVQWDRDKWDRLTEGEQDYCRAVADWSIDRSGTGPHTAEPTHSLVSTYPAGALPRKQHSRPVVHNFGAVTQVGTLRDEPEAAGHWTSRQQAEAKQQPQPQVLPETATIELIGATPGDDEPILIANHPLHSTIPSEVYDNGTGITYRLNIGFVEDGRLTLQYVEATTHTITVNSGAHGQPEA
jgi:hypothetical protein